MQAHQLKQIQIDSQDGSLTFVLASTRSGLRVERRYLADVETGTGFTSIGTIFDNLESFHQFCDADILRFTYPMIYMEVKKNAANFFSS